MMPLGAFCRLRTNILHFYPFRCFSTGSDTFLPVQVIFYKFGYFSAGSDTFLQVQILFYRFRYFSTCSDTFLQVQILFYRFRYCSTGSNTFLQVRILHGITFLYTPNFSRLHNSCRILEKTSDVTTILQFFL